MLIRIRCVAYEEAVLASLSSALSRLASALSVCERRSDRAKRSALMSVMADKKVFFNISRNFDHL